MTQPDVPLAASLEALERKFLRAARWIAIGVVLLGVLVVVAWQIGLGERLSLGTDQVPTAPGTGLLLILLGLSLSDPRPSRAEEHSASSRALAGAALALCTTVVFAAWFGYDLPFERWLSHSTATLGSIRLGRTSVVTALLFAVLASALLARRRSETQSVAGAVLALVLAGSLVILQGYTLGQPLLFGDAVIPVAAPTAVLVAALSLAALLHLGPRSWPARLFVPDTRIGVLPTRGGFVWFALLLAAVVVGSGFFWYLGEVQNNQARTESTLDAVAALKSREIAIWHSGDRAAAQMVSQQLTPAAAIVQQARAPANSAERAAVTTWLASLRTDRDFERVELFDERRQSVMVVGESREHDSELLDSLVRTLPSTDGTLEQHVSRGTQFSRLIFWAPLARQPGRDDTPGAWIALVVAAEDSLLPMLHDFPAAYRTGEFALWHVDGDSISLLSSGLRDVRDSSRVVLSASGSTALIAEALRGEQQGYRGVDYRGIAVRAAVRAVSGTPWHLVAKVNAAEIREPVLRAALRATFVTLFSLLGVAAAIYALWYRRDLARATSELTLLADRERSLAEIRRNEARYTRAMQGTSDGLWDWDLLSNELFISPRWREIVGVPGDAAVLSIAAATEYFDPADVDRHAEVLTRHLEHGEPYDIEMRLRDRGQGVRWIHTRGEVERDTDGRPLRLGGATTDITRRKLTDARLKRSERVLRMRSAVNRAIVRAEHETELFQIVCDIGVKDGGYRMTWIGLKEYDDDRSVTPVAIAGEEHGYLRENPVTWADTERGRGPTGRCIRLGVPQVAQDLLAESNYAPWRESARQRGYQSSLSVPLVVGNETIGAFMLYAEEPHAFDSEELALVAEIGRDISFGFGVLRDHGTLEAQREQLALFRQAIDRSADAIYVADVRTGLFIDFNASALAQLGYSDAEMRDVGPADIVVDFDAQGGINAVANAVRGSGGMVRTSVHRCKDGSEVPVEVALSVLEVGQETLMLGIARDISERVKSQSERDGLQAQLTRAQKMESVGRLAGGVAHDFNNLLTVITTSADLALAELGEQHPVQRDIHEIRSAGERAARLTRQLLAFSRQQVLKREVLQVNEVVSHFLTMLSRLIGEDVHLDLKLGEKVPQIFADAGQLEQVLMNLCVNARDAMPRGGTLTIETGDAMVDEEHAAKREGMTAGHYVTLVVTDTGSGMDKATLAKIFDPFFTTKEQGRGTGLGLSTVYGIVKQSGGSIWVYSELGIGTTFRIYLPVTTEVSDEQVSVPKPSAQGGRETVLVVEDEASIRFVARRVLERSGFTVLEADSGAAALTLLAEHGDELDLVMTDLVMPGMTGIELAQELRRTRPDLKVLFTSGYSAEVVSDRFHLDQEWNFISKPYGVRELVQEVRRVLDT